MRTRARYSRGPNIEACLGCIVFRLAFGLGHPETPA